MLEAERKVVLRDFAIFWLKLLLDGAKDVVLLPVATAVILIDLISGRGRRPRLFYSLLRQSERFDLWLNLNGALDEMERGNDDDGLFGASRAGSDTLLGEIEKIVKGKEE
jgi:hypothetical protein